MSFSSSGVSMIKVGVMGSAENSNDEEVKRKATALGEAISRAAVVLLTGATTGIVYEVGRTARDAGTFHLGISPAANQVEHLERYRLPIDACSLLVYTGFGLKGRNVVLVRSCDIVLFIAGAMGSLNEFTIAYDEGKIIGCLRQTGGVADEVDYLLSRFAKPSDARVFQDDDPAKLLAVCLSAHPA